VDGFADVDRVCTHFDGQRDLANHVARVRAYHAAVYRHANAQRNSMVDSIAIASGSEIELLIGNIETTLYFTQTHLADAKA